MDLSGSSKGSEYLREEHSSTAQVPSPKYDQTQLQGTTCESSSSHNESLVEPIFSQQIPGSTLPYSFLHELSDESMSLQPRPSTSLQPILPRPILCEGPCLEPFLARENTEFIQLVRNMRKELFSVTSGLVLETENPPTDKNFVKKWTNKMKELYGQKVMASVSHKRSSFCFFCSFAIYTIFHVLSCRKTFFYCHKPYFFGHLSFIRNRT